ncbi:MAG: ABC transporter permease [Candidatus Methanomethyliaceae archaeon]
MRRSSMSVVNSAHVISKVYFPRLILPLSGVLGSLVDFALAFVVLVGMMIYYRVALTSALLLLPALILLAMATALGVSLWLAALNVQYRDVTYLIPFLTQVWMYATPVVYSSTLIPERWRALYGLNPMAGVVEGFRWALLGQAGAGSVTLGPPGVALFLLISGLSSYVW